MKTLIILLCSVFITSTVFAYTVCRDKCTGEYVNDFQGNAKKDGTLIGNAVRAGLGSEEDFEEIEVSKEEFIQIKESVIASMREKLRKENEKKTTERKAKINQLKGKLGLSDEEYNLLKGE